MFFVNLIPVIALLIISVWQLYSVYVFTWFGGQIYVSLWIHMSSCGFIIIRSSNMNATTSFQARCACAMRVVDDILGWRA